MIVKCQCLIDARTGQPLEVDLAPLIDEHGKEAVKEWRKRAWLTGARFRKGLAAESDENQFQ